MAWRTWRKLLGDGQMGLARISLSLLLIASFGCASTPATEESAMVSRTMPEATPAALTKETQWDVAVKSAMPLRYEVSFGPFSTSVVNTGIYTGKDNRGQKPTGETVQFLNDTVGMSFELSHSSGSHVKVRAAEEADGTGYQLGQFVLKESLAKTGSVSKDGSVIGQFSIRKPSSFNHVSVSERRQGVPAGTVSTPLAEIQVFHRFEAAAGSDTRLGQFLAMPDDSCEEYRFDGKVVAVRRGVTDATIWIDASLPVDVQLCIASAMTVPIAQQAIAVGASRAASFNSSMMRLAR